MNSCWWALSSASKALTIKEGGVLNTCPWGGHCISFVSP